MRMAEGNGGRRAHSKPSSFRSRISSVEELGEMYDEKKWTIFSASQNLPAALNDPLLRETDLFTRTWGESFTAYANLPASSLAKIELSDFKRYLRETMSGRKSHRAIVRELKGGAVPSSPSTPVPHHLVQLDGCDYDIHSVPKMFLQQDFSLSDRRTFLDVIPISELVPSMNNSSSHRQRIAQTVHHSSRLLHDKLTHHLDVVEVHLAHRISMRSDMFFSTLVSQRELESLILTMRQDVLELRHKIRTLDRALTEQPLHLYQLQRRQSRLSSVSHLIQRISEVHQTQHTIQLLLRTSDFVSALELISTTQQVLLKELQGIKSLRHLSSQLSELEKVIEKVMEADFVHFAVEHIQHYMTTPNGEEQADISIQLDSVVKGLLIRRKLHFLSVLREELMNFCKKHIKKVVEDYLGISDGQDDDDDPTPSLSTVMRQLSHDDWMVMLEHVFNNLLSFMAHIKATLNQITEVCQDTAGVSFNTASHYSCIPSQSFTPEPVHSSPPLAAEVFSSGEDYLDQLVMEEEMSDAKIQALALSAEHKREEEEEEDAPQQLHTKEEKEEVGRLISVSECQQLVSDCYETLCALCDLIHSRCGKILSIRAKHSLLDDLVSSEFVRLVRLITRFVNSSVPVTGRQSPHLRSIIISQGKKFFDHFHEEKKTKLGLLLDGERWRPADVPQEIQRLTTNLETGFPEDASLYQSSDVHQHTEQTLTVHGQEFIVVGVLLLIIKMVTEYCQCLEDLPMLVTDIMSRLVELLKHFNTRTCQLVLGAGAMEIVGLKTITTRHLALVLRSLQVIMLLLPDVKAHFRKRLTPQQCWLLSRLDQVSEDMGSHCREINKKLLTIMTELVRRELDKWDVKQPAPSPPFKTITKKVLQLHEALEDVFPPDHLKALFEEIESEFITQMKDLLRKLNITNDGGRQHGVVHAELSHMRSVLGSLEHIKAFGSSLFDIWTTEYR